MQFSLLPTALTTLLVYAVFPFTTIAQAPSPPASLLYFATANISLANPTSMGVGPLGERSLYPITGGTLTGPTLSGTILPYGGDWGLGNPATGNFYVDARFQVRTPNGANIYVQANGPQQPGGLLHTRMRFETGAAGYTYLNQVVGVGIVSVGSTGTYIVSQMYRVVTP